MNFFIAIDYDARAVFDFYGEDFKNALSRSLKIDPEMLGWSPESCEGIITKWNEKKWEFENGHFDKYVDLIYSSYMTRSGIEILEITDASNISYIKQNN